MDEVGAEGEENLRAVLDPTAVLCGQVGGGNAEDYVLSARIHMEMDLAAHPIRFYLGQRSSLPGSSGKLLCGSA